MKTLGTVAAILFGLLLVLPAPADDIVANVGSVSPWGYTLGSDGYWHKGGRSYTRTLVQATPGYWYCGRYYAGTEASYVYTEYVKPYVAPVVPKLTYSANWKTEALRTLAARDDLVAFTNTVGTLNSTSIQPTYPTVPNYGGTPYGLVSGQTLYARGGFNAFSQALYSTTDINLANMLAGRLTQNAQQLAGQAHTDFTALVAQQGDAAAQIAKIQALAAAVQPPAVSNSTSFQFKSGVESVTPSPAAPFSPQSPQAPLMPRAAGDGADALTPLWNESCAQCHTGAQAKNGFTLDVYRGMTRQSKIDRVWSRLVNEDQSKLMPRGKDGVGHRLPDQKLQVFYDDISRQK